MISADAAGTGFALTLTLVGGALLVTGMGMLLGWGGGLAAAGAWLVYQVNH